MGLIGMEGHCRGVKGIEVVERFEAKAVTRVGIKMSGPSARKRAKVQGPRKHSHHHTFTFSVLVQDNTAGKHSTVHALIH